MIEITEELLVFQQAAMRARLVKVLLDVRSGAYRDGWTDETLAARLRWTVEKWRERILNPTLDNASDIALACGCELEWGSTPLIDLTLDDAQNAVRVAREAVGE